MIIAHRSLLKVCLLTRELYAIIVRSLGIRSLTVLCYFGIKIHGEPVVEMEVVTLMQVVIVVVIVPFRIKGVGMSVSLLTLMYPTTRLKLLLSQGVSML